MIAALPDEILFCEQESSSKQQGEGQLTATRPTSKAAPSGIAAGQAGGRAAGGRASGRQASDRQASG